MEQPIILKPTLELQFKEAMDRGRVVLFSAPCGFGKTTMAKKLLSEKQVVMISAGEPNFVLPEPSENWDTLLLDDLQYLTEEEDQKALCSMIRENIQCRFVLVTRGTPPGYLSPFRIAGVMTVLEYQDLALDRESSGELLRAYGVEVSDRELSAIHEESRGCPLALVLLVGHLIRGEHYSPTVSDQVRRELFDYIEETVFRRMDLALQQLTLELSPFNIFTTGLARMVSGNSRAGELLDRLQLETTAMFQDQLDTYHFWPIFRLFLQWEMDKS